MPAIMVEEQLYQQAEVTAQIHQTDLTDLFSQALRRYLWELDRRKIAQEGELYRKQHADLKKKYLGVYIAMHQGQVVDHDAEFDLLRQRVRQQFGRTPVMMTLVTEEVDQPLTSHSFRMKRGV
ncbi:hypothetical protein QUF58_07150 [Anaerolineales bacterium HSG24]|nr:hypothetical protein [Anaerolineales bacterium HSG24]